MDVLLCEIRGRRCAVPVGTLRGVFAVPQVTPVPTAPPVVRGLAPHHGQVLPLIDLGVYLGNGEPPPVRAGEPALVIEAELGDGEPSVRAALAVDQVLRMATVEAPGQPPDAAPPFVTALVVADAAPTLLIDPAAALRIVSEAARGPAKGPA